VYDVVIVGGGPAGLATALLARHAGLSVVVLEPAELPVDRACGEGLMPDGLVRLEGLGVAMPAGRWAPFRGIRFVDGLNAVDGRFPSGSGAGIRRTALHEALAARAAAEGAELRWGWRAVGLGGETVATDHGPVPGRWIVGADGRASRVRVWAGIGLRPGRERVGVRAHFAAAPWSDRVEVHFARKAQAYVTPVGPDLMGVAVLSEGEARPVEDALPAFPRLQTRLAGTKRASRERGAAGLGRRAQRVVSGRVALIGDAAGSIDPITGEGMSIAFADAEAVVAAIRTGDLGRYERESRRLRRLPALLARLILIVADRPRLRRRVLRVLSVDTAAFDRLLGVHARQLSPRALVPLLSQLALRIAFATRR
jgi:menaquinone-9 beta-reductase